MKRKIHKLLSNLKQGLLALALTAFSGTAYSQTTYTFNYTGAVQTLVLQPGSYSIQCWGAIGETAAGQPAGGIGGYSTGTYSVTAPMTLYIAVGGKGNLGTATNQFVNGGWNGGGQGYGSTVIGAGGGGASHVATATGVLSSFSSNQSAVLIVAGGGGGSGWAGVGGNGGGTTGGNGNSGTGGSIGGTFGSGANGTTAGTCGGGGGGWFGGNLGSPGNTGGAGGGSGYIGGVTSGTTAQTGQTGFVAKPITAGDGLVIIKELCSITLTATGVNANGAICAGSSVTLTTNAISNYSWSTAQTTSSIVVTPASTTLYSLSATSPSNCNSSAAITITVNAAAPTLTVTNSASSGGICPNTTATLTATGATTYTWTGGTPVTNGVSFSPSAPSGYTVSGQNACGTTTAATSISVHPLPVINVSASSSTLCSGGSLTLTASGNYTNHTWAGGYSSGVGFFPTLTNTYVATGTSSLSCTNTAAVIVTVVATPVLAPVLSSPAICLNKTATITASGATNYTWMPGNFSTSSITVSPAQTTTYVVTKSNANCVDSKTIVLTVNPLPSPFAIVTPTVICALKTATLFGGGAQTFTWTATNFTTTGLSPLVAPNVPTTYTVTGSDGTCTNTTTVFLAVDPNPTVTASANPSVICLGQTTTLTPTGGVNYTWTATTGTVYTAVHTDNPTQPTLYTLTGDNAFGCTSSVNQIVLVNQLPPVTIAGTPTLVCVGGNAKLTAGGANSYQWDAGASGVTTATAQVNPQTTTSYTVEGTNSATGCKNQKSITITVFEPSVAVSSPTSTCYGGLMNIVASGATSYTWHLGGGVTVAFATAQVNPTVLTIYTVTALTSTIGGLSCPSTNTTSIDIFYNPTITATSDRPSICKDESVKLFGAGGVTYSWNDPQSQNGTTITVTPQLQTTYTVTGIDSNGCVSTGTVLVKVSPCVGIGEYLSNNAGIMVYPNPNTGEFTIRSNVDIRLTLSNELGQVIRTFELSGSNDSKLQVTDLAKGIYFISGQKDGVTVNQKIIVTK